MEVIFIEGDSTDNTWEKIQLIKKKYSNTKSGFTIKSYKQKGKGKAEAVFLDLRRLQMRFYSF